MEKVGIFALFVGLWEVFCEAKVALYALDLLVLAGSTCEDADVAHDC